LLFILDKTHAKAFRLQTGARSNDVLLSDMRMYTYVHDTYVRKKRSK